MKYLPASALVCLLLVGSLFLVPATSHWSAVSSSGTNLPRLEPRFRKLPLRFEINEGQMNPQVRFLARTADGTVFLTPKETVMRLPRLSAENQSISTPQAKMNRQVEYAVVRSHLLKSNPKARISGLDRLPGVSNYLIGKDPRKWRTNVAGYTKVKYENIYSGIDLIYYGNDAGQIEYDFRVAPAADPGQIAMSFEGADKVEVDPSGELILKTAIGPVRQQTPHIYQEVNGQRQEISGAYKLVDSRSAKGKSTVAFAVGEYDPSRELVIDPTVIYATLLGGANGRFEAVEDITVDAAGNAYLVGETQSSDFPTKTPLQGALKGTVNLNQERNEISH